MTPNGSLSPAPDAQAALNLRPLSLGELLDRAFNIYFRHIAVFSALVAVVVVPSVLINYFQSRDLLNFYISTIQHQIESPSSTPDLSKLSALAPSDAWIGIQWALLVLGFPFAYGAVVAGVSRAYLGLPVYFADSYRYALRRWLPILILVVLWFAATLALIIGMTLIFVFGTVIAALASKAIGNNPFFGISSIIFVLAATLGLIGVAIMLYLTSAISFISVVIEKVDPIRAFGTAFARMFGAGQFWRGFALALALTGINLGASLVGAGGGALLAYIFKAPALYLILAGMTELFFAPFAVITAAVFYYDVRVRREGYDLQMLVERFSGATIPAAPSE